MTSPTITINICKSVVHTAVHCTSVRYYDTYLRHFDLRRPIFQCRRNLATKEEKGEEKVTHLETTIAFWRKEASGFFACLLTCFPCFFCEKVASSRLNFQFVFVLFQCQVVIIKKGKKWFEETTRKRYSVHCWSDYSTKIKKKKESVPWYRT